MRIVWDDAGKKRYELGVDRGVLFLQNRNGTYASGVPWNGLTAVNESSDGGDSNNAYADNMVYARRRGRETFRATVEAFTYPDEFEECDGSAAITNGVLISQQKRKRFGFSWRSLIGDDLSGMEAGYKLHIVWNARADPTEKGYGTVNESPDTVSFSWEISSDGVTVEGYKDTASIAIDSTLVDPDKLAEIEDMLYGTASTAPRLPTPEQILAVFKFVTEGLLDSVRAAILDSGNAAIQARAALF